MRLLDRVRTLLRLPERMECWMAAIDDALAELDAGVEEVAAEMTALAAAVDAGTVNADQVAGEIRARAARLRDIRPDPTDGGTAPVDGGGDAPTA